MTDHPITPPPELVEKWYKEASKFADFGYTQQQVAIQAAQWGADQELDACCAETKINWHRPGLAERLRTARRPKPPSLKEQALKSLDQADEGLSKSEWQQHSDTIRRALNSMEGNS